jgi:hypothetical protein
MKELKDTD